MQSEKIRHPRCGDEARLFQEFTQYMESLNDEDSLECIREIEKIKRKIKNKNNQYGIPLGLGVDQLTYKEKLNDVQKYKQILATSNKAPNKPKYNWSKFKDLEEIEEFYEAGNKRSDPLPLKKKWLNVKDLKNIEQMYANGDDPQPSKKRRLMGTGEENIVQMCAIGDNYNRPKPLKKWPTFHNLTKVEDIYAVDGPQPLKKCETVENSEKEDKMYEADDEIPNSTFMDLPK